MRKSIHGINIEHVYKSVSEEELSRLQNGKWENSDVQLVKKFLVKTDSVLELGGCTGILSCVINKLVAGSHTVVEPNPEMIECLEETRDRNGCNFEIKNVIISNNKVENFEVWDFRLGSGCPRLNGRRNEGKNKKYGKSRFYDVEGIPLEGLKENKNTLFCDIEGAEYSLIEQNLETLKTFEKLFFEFHHRFNTEFCNKKIHDLRINQLKEYFNLIQASGNVFYFERIK